MKKIGETESGSIIVEISADEWLALIAKDDDLYEWQSDFREKLFSLGLPTRIHGAIFRAASITTTRFTWSGDEHTEIDCPPRLYQESAFKIKNRLLSFDEWIELLAIQDPLFVRKFYIQGLGVKSEHTLLEAAKKYVENK